MQKREKMLVGVAGGAALIFLVNQFVCSDKPAPEVAQKVQVSPAATAAQPEIAAPAAEPRVRVPRKPFTFATWGRDPFAEAFRLARFDTTQNDSNGFVLRGVIWKGNEAHALIGDLILKEGEQSGDLKVLDIDKNRVVCKKAGRIVTLALRDDEI